MLLSLIPIYFTSSYSVVQLYNLTVIKVEENKNENEKDKTIFWLPAATVDAGALLLFPPAPGSEKKLFVDT